MSVHHGRMRIAIDGRKLVELGIGTYVRGLLTGLSRIRIDDRIHVLVPREFADVVPATFEPVVVEIRNHGLTELLELRRLVERLDVDVFHSPFVSIPRTDRPCIVTLHDAITQQFPSRNPVVSRYFAYMNRRAARLAARILTVSHAAKNDVVAATRCAPEKVVVTYNGVDESFFRRTPPNTTYGRYVLYVGGDGAHKNVAGLLKAFTIVRTRQPEMQLVLTGGDFRRHRLPDGARTTGFVTRDELAALYRGATAVVMPSFVEGFGLPAVEAMAAGTPVVTSMAAALLEITDDAALHADERSPEALAGAIIAASTDERLRARLVAAGDERVRRFTWEACARATWDVYREVGRSG